MKLDRVLKSIALPAWTPYALALAALLAYAVQSFVFAHTNIPNLDEGSYLVKGYLFATGEYQPFQPGINISKAPLSFLIPGYVQLLFGAGLRTGRYLAVFFGMATVVGTWFAARRLVGNWLAAGAAWTLAASPMVIKYYSGAVTQSLIACLMAWILFFSLGEGRKAWQLTLAGALSAVMIFVRQNMLPVLPLLILYAFWRHGRKAWGLTLSGLALFGALFYVYFPGILQLWYWVPYFNLLIPREYLYLGGGFPARWKHQPSVEARLQSVFQTFRYHFIPLAGGLISLCFAPILSKTWRARGIFKDALFLFLLFYGLLYMHFQAAVLLDYCVFCFSPYVSFFNVAGILLVALLVQTWKDSAAGRFSSLLASFLFLPLGAGIGFSAFAEIGRPLLNLPVPRARGFQILPGWTTWKDLLAAAFGWEVGLSARVISAAFGLLLAALILAIGYIILRRAAFGFGKSFAALILALGIVFSPALHGNIRDCDMDVIAAAEEVGAHLRQLIPPGSSVYWHGSLSATPLLYLPEAKIFPPQINAAYTFLSGSDTAQAIKFGYWNEELDAQWKASADFFIVEQQYYMAWKEFFTPARFVELKASPPTSCQPKSRLRIFRRE